eukprot:3424678-Rhodomonas_salina.2
MFRGLAIGELAFRAASLGPQSHGGCQQSWLHCWQLVAVPVSALLVSPQPHTASHSRRANEPSHPFMSQSSLYSCRGRDTNHTFNLKRVTGPIAAQKVRLCRV